jgi:hypothetical protein
MNTPATRSPTASALPSTTPSHAERITARRAAHSARAAHTQGKKQDAFTAEIESGYRVNPQSHLLVEDAAFVIVVSAIAIAIRSLL